MSLTGFIDTHAHLDSSDFDGDREEVINRARAQGVTRVINVSSSIAGCLRSLELAGRYEGIYASIGVHPHEVKEIDQKAFGRIEGLVHSPKVIAIGEVGLDFYRNLSPEGIQREFFKKFIDLSIACDLPLIIHSRGAEAETLAILKNSSAPLKGVVHCFSGSRGFLEECLALGLYISFTGNITYKKSDSLRELVKYITLDRLLLETDCPYLSPEGLRGKRNEPANVRPLAEFIARLRNCSVEEAAIKTTENAMRLFAFSKCPSIE